jgi:hypothetical protein
MSAEVRAGRANGWKPKFQRDPQRNYNYLLFFGRAVAFFNGVDLAHVFALLGFAVITRTFLVIDVAIGIDPYHSMATARCRCSVNFGRTTFSRRRGSRCAFRFR